MSSEYSALSRHILSVCLEVKTGQRVWINSWDHTLDLASELAMNCRKRGCEVLLTVQPEDLWLRSIKESPIEHLDKLPVHMARALEETDVYIFTIGPKNPIPWDTISSDRRKSASIWLDTRYDKSKFAEQWAQIARKRRVRMLAIEATLATPERAESMGFEPVEWRRVMFEGCLADPEQMASLGRPLERIMSGEGEAHMTTPFGTDVHFRLDKQPPDYSYGLATEEKAAKGEVVYLPTGGIEVSIAEDSAEGKIVYDTVIRSAKGRVEGLVLEVADGKIKNFFAQSGKEIFEHSLKEGADEENRVSYFGFGLNPKLRYGFGQDDKVLGSTIVGLGRGRWWAAMTQATVTVDDQRLMKAGTLLV